MRTYSWLQPCEKAAALGFNIIEFFLEEFIHETRGEKMLLFMTTNMAIVTSRENQQYRQSDSKFYFLI